MNRALVGTRKGRRVIHWPGVLLMGLIVGGVSGVSGAATWYLLTGTFDRLAVLFPVFLFAGFFTGMSVRRALVAAAPPSPRSGLPIWIERAQPRVQKGRKE